MELKYNDILNAFVPSKIISKPEQFSGRVKYINNIIRALLSEGANIAIIGDRGIGKSSMAYQLKEISHGNNELLEILSIPVHDKFDYFPVMYTCGNGVHNIEELLKNIIDSNDQLYELYKREFLTLSSSIHESVQGSSTEIKAKGSIDIMFVGNGGVEGVGNLKSERIISNHTNQLEYKISTEEAFIKVCKVFLKENPKYKKGLLFIIDEFDQIKESDGFASFLKSLETKLPSVKFCIVGIAEDISNLIREHQSVNRLFSNGIIQLPKMTLEELKEIVIKTQDIINNKITLSSDALNLLAKLANGHPYIIHLIGQEAFVNAFDKKIDIVQECDIYKAIKNIADSSKDPLLEGRYRKAVGSSKQREIVLKCLADSRDDNGECFTTKAYKMALDKDVENSSQYIGQLVANEYGAEVEKVRDKYYRFKDPLFHSYVLVHPYLHNQ